jgi:peroxiredoxin Q/BCP
MQIGTKAPEFCLKNQDGNEVCSRDFKGKWMVIYFYPKDDTPGCTTEACEFTAEFPNFLDMNAVILGVSADSVEKHKKFADKHSLTITLLSDPEHKVIESYGAWREKNMYGKKYMGIVRSTVLVNPKGEVAFYWDNVKAKGHAQEVKEQIAKLQK